MKPTRPIKVMLVADPGSIHSIRWYRALRDEETTSALLVGMRPSEQEPDDPNVISLTGRRSFHRSGIRFFPRAILFLIAWFRLNCLIYKEKPDIVHAHFASSYGLLAALSFTPRLIVSAWGKDVYEYPASRPWRPWILKFVFWRADKVLSTSHTMAKQVSRFTSKPIEITPFGVDTERFKPTRAPFDLAEGEPITIGLVKLLRPKYGIKHLIEAFSMVVAQRPDLKLRLLLVGDASESEIDTLRRQVTELALDDQVVFTGPIEHERVPEMHNMLDIAVYPSIEESESFGVSVLESSACGRPVIASRIGGLPEVVRENETGFLVPAKDSGAIASALAELLNDTERATRMGLGGVLFVQARYGWRGCVAVMHAIYAMTSPPMKADVAKTKNSDFQSEVR